MRFEDYGNSLDHLQDDHALPSEPVPTVDREALAQAIEAECRAGSELGLICPDCLGAARIVRTYGTGAT